MSQKKKKKIFFFPLLYTHGQRPTTTTRSSSDIERRNFFSSRLSSAIFVCFWGALGSTFLLTLEFGLRIGFALHCSLQFSLGEIFLLLFCVFFFIFFLCIFLLCASLHFFLFFSYTSSVRFCVCSAVLWRREQIENTQTLLCVCPFDVLGGGQVTNWGVRTLQQILSFRWFAKNGWIEDRMTRTENFGLNLWISRPRFSHS